MTSASICPRGHASSEADYCSECGAKMQPQPAFTGSGVAVSSPAVSTAVELCPDCGAPREQNEIAFCEVCGYNFTTGAHGELSGVSPPALVPPPEEVLGESPAPDNAVVPTILGWTIRVAVDPSLHGPGSPAPPDSFSPYTIALEQPVSLIGRRSEARAIFPEIALPHDDAVSHRHALLQLDSAGSLLLRDIGAANGTQLNGNMLTPMVDHPLHDGDEITLGHWSRLSLRAVH